MIGQLQSPRWIKGFDDDGAIKREFTVVQEAREDYGNRDHCHLYVQGKGTRAPPRDLSWSLSITPNYSSDPPSFVNHSQEIHRMKQIFGDFFPGGASGQESPANAGDIRDSCLVSGWRRSPGKGNGDPLQYSCLKNSMTKRILVGYSPWGLKELHTTERLTLREYEEGKKRGREGQNK